LENHAIFGNSTTKKLDYRYFHIADFFHRRKGSKKSPSSSVIIIKNSRIVAI
jgi:hypothetical protein